MPFVHVFAAGAWDWARFGIILIAGLVLAEILRRAIARAAARGDSDPRGAVTLGSLVRVIVASAALIYALAQLGVRIGPLLTAAGIGGVALAFAVRTIFENFLAGILLLLRRPFRPGDQIATNDHEGTVEEVNLRSVVMRTYDGQRVFVPNGKVLDQPIVNRTAFPSRRSELVVGVDYDADLAGARQVIVDALAAADDVHDDPRPEAYVYEFAASSVNLCVRFWHASTIRETWQARDAAAVAVKRALDAAGIGIPFPQMVVHPAAEGAPLAVRVTASASDDRPA